MAAPVPAYSGEYGRALRHALRLRQPECNSRLPAVPHSDARGGGASRPTRVHRKQTRLNRGPRIAFPANRLRRRQALSLPRRFGLEQAAQPWIVLRRPIQHSLESLEFVGGEGEITPVKQHGFSLRPRAPAARSINSFCLGMARRLMVSPPRCGFARLRRRHVGVLAYTTIMTLFVRTLCIRRNPDVTWRGLSIWLVRSRRECGLSVLAEHVRVQVGALRGRCPRGWRSGP